MKTIAKKAGNGTGILREVPSTRAEVREEPLGELRDGGLFISDEQLDRLWKGDRNRARKELRLLLADLREPKPIRRPTERPASVRAAGPDDERAIYHLLELAHEEFFHLLGPIDPQRLTDHIHAGTRAEGGIVGVIDGPEGYPVATCGIMPMQWYWSKQWFLQDLWQFVHPDHRKGNHAADLLEWEKWIADEWTRRFGYEVLLLIGVLSTRQHREKVRLFRRHVNQVGAAFLYPWPHGVDG